MYNRKQEKKYSETDIENLVGKAVKKFKHQYLKFFSRVSTGWPDRIILTRSGRTIWIEFKKPGGAFGGLQQVNRQWLIRNDHTYFQITSYERAKFFIANVLPHL